jgi:hypothetical protein
MLASIEMSGAPIGQHSVCDILNIMHDMPSTQKDIGISARTAEAARAAKLADWKVILQDWRDVGPHTTVWTADRDEYARELATQQQDFNENPFIYEHLQIRWAMMAVFGRLTAIWKEEQGNEMTGLLGCCCLKKVKRRELPMGTRVISSRFHF